MQLFFKENIKGRGIDGLDEEESKHIIKVLRLAKDDTFHLTDGKGTLAKVRITNANAKKCEIETVYFQQITKGKNFYIHLVIAPTKNAERIEWLIEKCVEIGIDEISFVITKHTERIHFNTERIEKKAITALKQSLQTWLPKINAPQSFETLVQEIPQHQKFIAYVDNENTATLFRMAHIAQTYCILIGPEGDFSKEELQIALNADFLKISLGANRLRTETAGLVACCTLNLLNEK
jgi:16S rRNA (uracil1498-N3)-methyltransferase